METLCADVIDLVIKQYGDKHGGTGKSWKILKAIRARWSPGRGTRSLDRDEIIREVWEPELKKLRASQRELRVKQLRNTFGTHKQIINTRLLELYQEGEGKNPWKIGLVKGDTFGPLGSINVKRDLRDYAREIQSPWLIERTEILIELMDTKGESTVITKREVLIPLLSALKEYTHLVGSDGPAENFEVHPGQIVETYIQIGRHNIIQRFSELPLTDKPYHVMLRYTAKESFMNRQEYYSYFVHYPTAMARITVKFPPDRPCKSDSAIGSRFIGLDPIADETQPTLNEQKDELTWEITHPRHKDRYNLKWNW